jgi:hypothetical protein
MFTSCISAKRLKFSGPNVLSYDPAWLISCGWIIPTKASFLHSWTLIIAEIVLVALTTVLAYFKCPTVAAAGGRTLAGTVSCLPLPDQLTSSLTLLTIASFMMGLFATNVLHRWWSTRVHVASVGGSCKNFTILLTAWTSCAVQKNSSKSADEETVTEHRARALRLLTLAHALLFNTARNKTAREDLEPLVAAGTCEPEEADVLAGAGEPFLAVLGWVACVVDELQRAHGALNDTQAGDLHMSFCM